MPQTPVTSKTLLNRAERRAILRSQLRDAGESIWTDAVLNDCLNEALLVTRSRYPWVRSSVLASGKRLYDLPADFVRLVDVMAVKDADSEGFDLDSRPPGRVVAGYSVAAGPPMALTSTLATDTAKHVIQFDEIIPDDETWYVVFEAATQDWGDPSVVDSGVDVVDQDLCPGELTDGVAPLLFYAAARCAAYRYALNYIKADGGDDFAAQYEYAVRERDGYLGESAAGSGLRFTTGLFG